MAAIHHTRQYRLCVQELKNRGRFQTCITAGQHPNCPTTLDTQIARGHRGHMTLGHIHSVEDGGAPYDPRNYGPQCEPCNYSEGGRVSLAIQQGRHRTELTTSPDWA